MAQVKERKNLPPITNVFLNVTQKCNLKCKYCFVCQQPKEITLDVAKDAARFVAKNALKAGRKPSINFFGGEPMLKYEDIIKPLTLWIRENYGDSFELSLTTNGMLLTEEIMKFFDENDVGMLFSIDGDKETQDINRPRHDGRGSFEQLEPVIDLVLKYHPTMTFRATVDTPTHKNLYKNYRFAVGKGYTNCFFIPNVFHDWSEQELSELDAELDKVCDYYIEELKAGRKPCTFNHFEEAIGDIRKIIDLKDGEFREPARNTLGGGRCGIGVGSSGGIGVKGDIYTCQEMVENPDVGEKFKIGNIYEGVDDSKRRAVAEMYDAEEIKCSDESFCEDCPKKRICDGGCCINNFFKYDSLNVIDYVMCWYERKCIEKAYRILSLQKKGELKWV